ncbi:hypothetical protein C4552_03885 [Candidatus Parcubacteria bacterium]|nr:MAG: hypothetical protein C4552_03885 [Candidatus Parcubacteria bacterium]
MGNALTPMLRTHTPTTSKIVFFGIIMMVAAGLIAGVSFARDNPYLSFRYAGIWADTIRYAIEYRFGGEASRAAAGAISTTPPRPAESIPVLLYHGVVAAPGGINVPNQHFKEQMFALKRAGWETVTLAELYAFLRGEKKPPEKSFVLTFDDGRKDSYYPVDPVLKALDYRAVMFAITKFSLNQNSKYYLSGEELKQMIQSGRWEVHSHGNNAHEFYPVDDAGNMGHFFSNKLWLAGPGRLETNDEFMNRVLEDLLSSKRNLEDTLGTRVTGFAFPFGNFGEPTFNHPEARDIVLGSALSIYAMAFYQQSDDNRFTQNYHPGGNASEHFFIRRIEVRAEWGIEELLERLDAGLAKPLPFTDTLDRDTGWIRTWGVLEHRGGMLALHPTANDTGSAALLDGTRAWRDYQFTAVVDRLAGGNIYLWGRFKNDDNFVACNFSQQVAHVEQKYLGDLRVIRGVERAASLPERNFEVAIRVRGRSVECLLNGEVIVATPFLERALDSGGVGIKGWDARPDASQLVLREVRAIPLSPATAAAP